MKSQSAMEYLMTYGWAVLIIAIVIAVLFDLGIFGAPTATTTCVAQAGFLCTSPILTNTGVLYVQFAQNSGGQMNITGLGCSNSSIAPINFNNTFVELQPGQQINMMFPCQINSQNIGTHFTGTLWIKYNMGAEIGLESQVGSINGGSEAGQDFYFQSSLLTFSIYGVSTQTNKINPITFPYSSGSLVPSDNTYAYVFSTTNLYTLNPQPTEIATFAQSISSLAVGPNGNAYVGTYGSNDIYILNPFGTILDNYSLDGGYSYNIEAGPNGNAYAVEYNSVSGNYGFQIIGPSIPQGSAVISVDVYTMAVSPNGYAYLIDGSNYLKIVSPTGTLVSNTPLPGTVGGYTFDSSGNYYVYSYGSNTLNILSSTGTYITNVILPSQPSGIAPAPNGVYVTTESDYLYIISQTGSILNSYQIYSPGYINYIMEAPNGNGYLFSDLGKLTIISPSGAIVENSITLPYSGSLDYSYTYIANDGYIYAETAPPVNIYVMSPSGSVVSTYYVGGRSGPSR